MPIKKCALKRCASSPKSTIWVCKLSRVCSTTHLCNQIVESTDLISNCLTQSMEETREQAMM